MPGIRRAHIISHTHWDREWYLNSPYTNAWLPPFFDALFLMLEREPGYRFVLDGQTSMIEDWCEQLEAQGQDSAVYLQRLSDYVRRQRVFVGPYYLQPDWQLASEEALVRNLLIGKQMSDRLGGRMQAGWLLDNFGQISQTAQIHRQFGITGLYVWRGVEMEPHSIQSEFLWEAPDGSQVMAVFLVGSYRNGMRLAAYPESMAGRVRREVEKLAPFASTPNILIMNGYDQEMQPDDILPVLRANAFRFGAIPVRQSTPQEYLDAIVAAGPGEPPWQVLRGGLYSGRYISVFPGILSSRMYLKMQNDACQRLLEKQAEPLATLLWGLGMPYPAVQLDRAWRLLLKNQPHDSICGVSVDAVHNDMEARFRQLSAIAKKQARACMATLAANVDTSRTGNAIKGWVILNTSLSPACGLVEVQTRTDRPVYYTDAGGQRLPDQKNVRGKHLVFVDDIPGLGYRTIFAHEGAGRPGLADTRAGQVVLDPQERTIENRWIRVSIRADGTLSLTEKTSGATYENLCLFEDGGDAGDAYNYSYPQRDLILTNKGLPAEITVLESGPLRAKVKIKTTLLVPRSLKADRTGRSASRVPLPVVTYITVEAGSPLVKFHTQVDNVAQDHRLRVLFPTGLRAGASRAETQFDVVNRPIQADRYDDSTIPDHVRQVVIGAREPEPVATFPQRMFVGLDDGQRGLAILNQGLPEYEILLEGNTIALTLFRSVGWIARPDLLTRTGDAGPMIAVPGAQCLRSMAFDYAVLAHSGDWETGRVMQQADGFNNRFYLVETGRHTGVLQPDGGFLRLDDPGGQLKVTAVKRAEDGKAMIVRFHNPTARCLDAALETGFHVTRAWTADLAEEPVGLLPVSESRRVQITVGPKKIITVRMEIQPAGFQLRKPQPGPIILEQVKKAPPGKPGQFFPSPISNELIAQEEERAAGLDALLALKEQNLAEFIQAGGPDSPQGQRKLFLLRLEAATCRRAMLEARLSETLLRKSRLQLEKTGRSPYKDDLAQIEATLRKIGDEINLARVEKRALEYVVDYYEKLGNEGNGG